ncbi:MAG: hypothetical protein COV31_02490 [Candidatus Yanofskybacteria bacterium CG10_big_fil_rev_8_21_14_0_10_46_23]|uniref:Uncharacterized protein n=1 Tax=Candidatus Yanofskybacteria bacterium CG10_big_fil_rev_8_21_14_0_10_46_23 TaxID=1975098 RepID=A0A2H0R401_9BACT|nr:MAG: hypothetical protein COV31_02490 [Candidatus Yanofskybacteria bacterium CG10_big_fil_rev_8_21_14_0_10_46_23]
MDEFELLFTDPSQSVHQILEGVYKNFDLGLFRSDFSEAATALPVQEARAVFGGVLTTLQIVGVIVTVILIVLLGWFLNRVLKFKEHQRTVSPSFGSVEVAREKIQSRWDEVRDHISSISDSEWKFAVVEADKLVEDALRQVGFSGDSMGEILKGIDKTKLASLQGLWDAHKLRNLIVHNTDFEVKQAEAQYALKQFEKALTEIGLL